MNNIETIANININGNKPNKANAFNALIDLIQSMDVNENNKYKLNELYMFFTPPIPAKPKLSSQWIKKALPKNDLRFYLNFIYSDGSRLIACDGSRIHLEHTNLYSEGYYDNNLNKIDNQGKYPDIDRVINTNSSNRVFEQVYTDYFNTCKVTLNKETEVINVNGDTWINRKFLLDAICFFDKNELIEFSYTKEQDAINLKQGDLMAIVMPIRIK